MTYVQGQSFSRKQLLIIYVRSVVGLKSSLLHAMHKKIKKKKKIKTSNHLKNRLCHQTLHACYTWKFSENSGFKN